MKGLEGYRIIYLPPLRRKYYKIYAGNGGKTGRGEGHTNSLPGGTGCEKFGDCFTCPLPPEECDGGKDGQF